MSQASRFSFPIAVLLLGLTLPVDASPNGPDLGRLPMLFEPNQGQLPRHAEFLSRSAGYTVLFERDKVRIYTGKAAVTMRILAPSRLLRIEGTDVQQGKSNYFIGNVPSKWLTGVPNYSRVRYRGVYPGIDLVFYGNGRQLEYDWIVSAGADPSRIRTRFEGVRGMRVDASGDLLLALNKDQLQWRRPVSYQGEGEKKVPVKADFIITKQRQVGFALGNYDRSRPLVIDPILSYATYIGGSGDDYLFALAVDGQGNSYVTGSTHSTNFPICGQLPQCSPGPGAYQTAFKASGNMPSAGFITKINPQGTALVYSTFIGGTGNNNGGTAIAVDSSGYAYVTGGTNSTDFPTVNPIQAQNNGGSDLIILKLSQDGSSLVYSTYLGSTGDETSQGIALDSTNNVYLTGWTQSTTSTALFPSHAVNPIQSSFGGGTYDGFLTKINSTGSAVVYSTYIGGNGDDNSFGVAVDPFNQAYISGQTNSTNFPTMNAVQSQYNGGGNDVFVTAVNASGTALLYSTYLGGDDQDRSRAIYVDSQSNAYVTGDTQSPIHFNGVPFPTTPNAYEPLRGGCRLNMICVGGSADAFLTKLNASGGMVYSTYFGGATGYDCSATPTYGCGADKGLGITLDPMGNIFIGGTTDSTDFPTASPTQPHNAGGYDAFVIKFNGDFSAPEKVLFSTYFGGSGTDYAYNLARTQQGAVYVSGWASNSFNFPHSGTPPLFPYGGGTYDGFVMKLANADISVVKRGFQAHTQSAAPHEPLPKAVSGGNYSYSTDLQNSASSEDADNGYMTVTAGGPTTLDSCTASAGSCNVSGNTVTVNNIPTFPHGTTIHITINGHINPSANPGDQVTLQGYGLSDTNDPDPSNNTFTDAFTVQPSCAFMVTSTTTSFSPTGGPGSFSANSPCGFGWTLSNAPNWIIASAAGPSGGPFSFSVLPNPTTATRSATLSISGQPLLITQAGDNGDFDGNGVPDLVWQNDTTRQVTVWYMGGAGGATLQGYHWLSQSGVPGWHVVAVADFNGDGVPDLVWQNDTTRQVTVWYMGGAGGATFQGYNWLSRSGVPGWHVVAVADFNGDGVPDLVWQNDTTRQVTVWYMGGAGGAVFQGYNFLSAAGVPGWHVAAAADFNRDGVPDLVWQNDTTRQVTVWYMGGAGGAVFQGFNYLSAAGVPGWHVVMAADFNADGVPDLVWQNDTTRQATVWYMGGAGGAVFQGYNYLSAAGVPGWSLVGE